MLKITNKESKPLEVIRGTDFYVPIDSITDRAGEEIDIVDAQFYFEFYGYAANAKINGCMDPLPEELYIVSHDGTNRVNNVVRDGKLWFIFENYPIKFGKIYCRQIDRYANVDFSDGSEDVVCSFDTGIEIKPSGQGTVTASDTFQGTVTLGGLYTESVKFSAQELKEPQQVQARENIKAVGVDEFTSKLNGIEAILDSIITTQESI